MNKVTLIGRIGQDLELKTIGETKLVNMSIATNDGTKDKPKTNWHNCTAFNKTAENIVKYQKKGSLIYIDGVLNYTKKDDKYYTSISVGRVEFLDSKSNSETSVQQSDKQKGEDDLPF